MIPDFEHTGYEINLKEREETAALFNALTTRYGDLIDFEGYKATAAGDYKLIIKLKDPESSYWNLNIKEEIIVNDLRTPNTIPAMNSDGYRKTASG